MPVYIQCTGCNRKLRVRTELLGKAVRCPGCQARFTAAAAENQAPPSGGVGAAAEASSALDGPESVLPSAQDQAVDESSGPTLRRPISPAPAVAAPSARQAITARPPQEVGEPRAPAVDEKAPAAALGEAGFETPWSRVELVVALILLGVVALGLFGALWVNAGIRAAQSKRAEAGHFRPALAAEIQPGRAAPQAGAAGTGCFRPRCSACSPHTSRSSA